MLHSAGLECKIDISFELIAGIDTERVEPRELNTDLNREEAKKRNIIASITLIPQTAAQKCSILQVLKYFREILHQRDIRLGWHTLPCILQRNLANFMFYI